MLNSCQIPGYPVVLSIFDTILIFFAAQDLRLPILVRAGMSSPLFFGKEQ